MKKASSAAIGLLNKHQVSVLRNRSLNHAKKTGKIGEKTQQVAMLSPSVGTHTAGIYMQLSLFSPDLSLSVGPSVFLVLLCYLFSCCPWPSPKYPDNKINKFYLKVLSHHVISRETSVAEVKPSTYVSAWNSSSCFVTFPELRGRLTLQENVSKPGHGKSWWNEKSRKSS